MKKIMFGLAASVALGLFAKSIPTSNTVGFNALSTGSSPYRTYGMCFVTCGETDGTFCLGDMAMEGSTWGTDWLNFIDPTTSIFDPSKNVTYYSVAEAIADGGTAADAEWEDINENCKDDVVYPIGTAFLCNFVNPNIKITFSGEVNANAEYSTINCAGRPYSLVVSPYPGDLTAGDIKLVGSIWGTDWLNFIDPATSIVDPSRNITYYSEAEAIADGGTAADAEWEDINENCKDDVEIPMGTGFLCNFASPSVQILFPVYTPSTED